VRASAENTYEREQKGKSSLKLLCLSIVHLVSDTKRPEMFHQFVVRA
jgi:hypothetical protein